MSVNVMTKENKRILAVFIIMAVFMTAVSIFAMVLSIIDGTFLNGVGTISESSYDLIGDISIDSNIGDIRIENDEVNNITVKVLGTPICANVETGQSATGDIFIKTNEENFFSAICSYANDIDIEVIVPSYYAKDVTINHKVGDIVMGDVGAVKINSEVGDIKINKTKKQFEIDHEIGEITINNATTDGESYINNSIGEIEIKNLNPSAVEAQTAIGGVKINRSYTSKTTIVRIKNSIGSIDISN